VTVEREVKTADPSLTAAMKSMRLNPDNQVPMTGAPNLPTKDRLDFN